MFNTSTNLNDFSFTISTGNLGISTDEEAQQNTRLLTCLTCTNQRGPQGPSTPITCKMWKNEIPFDYSCNEDHGKFNSISSAPSSTSRAVKFCTISVGDLNAEKVHIKAAGIEQVNVMSSPTT